MRIFPACYAYLLVLAVARALGAVSMGTLDFLTAATYTTNFNHERSWYAGHTWSLAVEEQFYLLWPFVMKLLAPRGARVAALAAMAAAPIIRIGLYRFVPSMRAGIGESFVTVADTLATGSLLALMSDELGQNRRYLNFLSGRAFWFVPVIVAVAAAMPSEGLRVLVGETVINLGLALIIDRFVRFPDSFVGRMLNSRPFVTVGTLSYSLYLWQQPFLNRTSTALVSHFPLNLALASIAAVLSYRVVEQPMLRLRSYLERRWRGTIPQHEAAHQPPV